MPDKLSEELMDFIFSEKRIAPFVVRGDVDRSLERAAVLSLMYKSSRGTMYGSRPSIGSRAPIRKRKVSPAKLAKRKKQSEQKRARKITKGVV